MTKFKAFLNDLKLKFSILVVHAQTYLLFVPTRIIAFLRRHRFTSTSSIIGLVAIFGLWYTLTSFIELSGLAFGLIKIPIGLAVIGIFDNIVLGELKTIEQIREGNIAYAIVYGAIILLVGFALGLS